VAGVDKKVSPNLNRASKVLGTGVVDSKGDKVGDIKDIVLDRSTGQVAYAVVSFGGTFGVGDKYFAVPWTALKAGQNERYVLDVNKDQLKQAQGFDKDKWPDMASEQWNRSNSRAFNQAPYWEPRSTAAARNARNEASSGSTGTGTSSKSGASDK
jgi:sporulation protein YlmC with PRC-barrel domain